MGAGIGASFTLLGNANGSALLGFLTLTLVFAVISSAAVSRLIRYLYR